MSLDFEDELVAADVDVVAIGECDAGTNGRFWTFTPLADFKSVITKPSGIDDYGVVSADIIVVQDDVVVGKTTYSGARPLQRIVSSGLVAQIGDIKLRPEVARATASAWAAVVLAVC